MMPTLRAPIRNPVCLIFCLTILVLCSSAEATTVRVGFCENYGIISSPSAGMHSGYGYSYLKALQPHTGWEYEFVKCDWEDCMTMLEKGDIDLFGPLQKFSEREEKYYFANYPQGFEYGSLYTLASNSRLFYNDFTSFNNMRVATVSDTYYEHIFTAFSQEKRFTPIFVHAKNIEEMIQMLEQGTVDAFICGNILEAANVKIIAKFSADPFYMAISKKRPELLTRLNKAIHELRTQDIYFEAKIYEQHYQDSAISQPAYTREEIDFIQKAPEIRVGLDPAWAPCEVFDPSSRRYTGIVADLLRNVERNSGLRLTFIETANYKETLDKFISGQLDMATLHTTIPTASESIATRSSPLLQIPVVLISKADAKPARNMTIGLFSHSTFEIEARTFFKDSRFVIYNFDAVNKAISGLYSGDISALLINAYAFDELLRNPAHANLRPLASTRFTLPVSLGINDNSNGLLTSVINKAIERITQEEAYISIFDNNLRSFQILSLSRVLNEYAYPLLIIIFFIVLLSLAAILGNKQLVEKRLRHVAFTDDKLDIPNKNCLEHQGPPLLPVNNAYVTFDINNFKRLNDYFGYESGDRMLVHIAETLKCFAQPTELAVRCNGDTFGMLLHCDGEHQLRKRLEELTECLVTFCPMRNMGGFNLSLAYGACLYMDRQLSIQLLQDRADIARKLFKNSYRTSYAFYDDEIHTHIMQERDIENKMAIALENGEFTAHFQPKYDLRKDRIVGAEALVRWVTKDHGIMLPCKFIPLFERNGFVVKLDMYILDLVCRHLQSWIRKGITPVPIAVNISKLHIMNKDFVNDVMNTVQRYNIPPQLIELELTETAFLENTELLLRIMNTFSAHGFTLSMDDFGTGYSSLNMLQEIPVHVLKLDRAFLDMSSDSERSKNIIAHVVHMARDLNMQVVCEGVETVDHVRFLKTVGCDMAQGFFYSPPVPVDAFAHMAFNTAPPLATR